MTDGVSPATDDLYEMANLYPRATGLPMTVSVSPRGGDRMLPEGAAVVGIRPEPRLIEGEVDTIELGQRLIRV